MFISCCGGYLALSEGRIVHKFLCTLCDDDAFPFASEEDLKNLGFEISIVSERYYVFYKKNRGYLSMRRGGPLWGFHPEIGRVEMFRFVSEEDLPPFLPEILPQHSIEKNLHQVGIYPENPGKYPEIFIENRNSVISLNSEYEYFFWSEGGAFDIKNFILENFGKSFLDYYNAINPQYGAVKADFFRYICLYVMGGVYFDLKTSIRKPLSSIIKKSDRFLVSFWHHNMTHHEDIGHLSYGEYEQYFIICAAGHPIMKRVIYQMLCNIKFYDPDISGIGHFGTLRLSGPIMYSFVLDLYKDVYKDGVRRIHTLSNGIEFSIFDDYVTHSHLMGVSNHYGEQKTPIVLWGDES